MVEFIELPCVVCLGAGTGQATVLRGLKNERIDLTAIVAVTDNGGASGKVRRAMNIPQMGDTRNCLVNTAPSEGVLTKLFDFRFTEGDLQGINLGNLVIAALTRIFGDFGEAVKFSNLMLQTKVCIMPVSCESTQICAELQNGRVIEGEWEIIAREDNSPIKKVFLKEKIRAYQLCLDVIRKADLIVIGPGSLFTGLVSNLLVRGISEAITNSSGSVVYIVNLMTQHGQTDNFAVSHHIKTIENYLCRKVDYVLVNSEEIPEDILTFYKNFHSYPIVLDKSNIENPERLILTSLISNERELYQDKRQGGVFKEWGLWTHLFCHDPKKVTKVIMDLL